MLCRNCQCLKINDIDLDGSVSSSDDGVPHFKFHHGEGRKQIHLPYNHLDTLPNLPMLKESADSGCGFCSFLRNAILRTGIQVNWIPGEIYIGLEYDCGNKLNDGLYGLYVIIAGLKSEETATLLFTIWSRDDTIAHWLGVRKAPHMDTLCPENMNFMQKCIDSGDSDDQNAMFGRASFLPTRLIEVSPESTPDCPRLIISSQSFSGHDNSSLPPQPKYAALSYCWGTSTQLTTKSSTLRSNLKGIQSDTLPKVIQDAIQVCNALSIKYLWVDALCIIQDSNDMSDWHQESEKMGLIYRHAYVTIAAVASESCDQSFLSRSARTFDVEFCSTLCPGIKGVYTLVDRGIMNGYATFIEHAMAVEVTRSKWFWRGWTYQEWQLSRRVLMFGPTMIHFLSDDFLISEQQQDHDFHPQLWHFNGELSSDITRRGRPKMLKAVSENFMKSAANFCERTLTVKTDRLPAIAGLAKLSANLTGDQYLAGHWRTQLHWELLWKPVGSCPERLDDLLHSLLLPEPYIAPSWSWASRHVYFDYDICSLQEPSQESHLVPEYTAIIPSITLSSENVFGPVKKGTLEVHGKGKSLPSKMGLLCKERRDLAWKGSKSGKYIADYAFDWGNTYKPTRFQMKGKVRRKLKMLLLSSACSHRIDMPESEEDDAEGKWEDKKGGNTNFLRGSYRKSMDAQTTPSGPSNTSRPVCSDNRNDDQKEQRRTNGTDWVEGLELARSERKMRLAAAFPNGGWAETDKRSSHSKPLGRVVTTYDEESTDDCEDMESSRHSTVFSNKCNLCSTPTHNRHAWGLVLYPTEISRQYYRVGVFVSSARGSGGTDYFRNVPVCKWTIV